MEATAPQFLSVTRAIAPALAFQERLAKPSSIIAQPHPKMVAKMVEFASMESILSVVIARVLVMWEIFVRTLDLAILLLATMEERALVTGRTSPACVHARDFLVLCAMSPSMIALL